MNRHMESEAKKKLNKYLASQEQRNSRVELSILHHYKQYAKTYAEIHNGIAVLSDLTANWSYTFMGQIAQRLHLSEAERKLEINSIWEDFLLERVHPEDLAVKHALELQFLDLLKRVPLKERFNYRANTVLRIGGKGGQTLAMSHQIVYLNAPGAVFPQLALCCYTLLPDTEIAENNGSYIFNQLTGMRYPLNEQGLKETISNREKQILNCIKEGMISKDIAAKLDLSIHTVNRHRQNILQKLQVRNSHEAVQVFSRMSSR